MSADARHRHKIQLKFSETDRCQCCTQFAEKAIKIHGAPSESARRFYLDEHAKKPV